MTEVESRDRRLLLISNSTLYGGGYLDHAEKEIRDFLGAVGRALFVPSVVIPSVYTIEIRPGYERRAPTVTRPSYSIPNYI